jgi:hypothetical protein
MYWCYIDDLFDVNTSHVTALWNFHKAGNLYVTLQVNESYEKVVPFAQKVIILIYEVDSVKMTARISNTKVEKILSICAFFVSKKGARLCKL